MTKQNPLILKFSNSQLIELKPGMKNGNEVTWNLSSNLIATSNNETKFSNKLLLTDAQVSEICKPFANGSSANIKFFKNV